MNKFLKLLSLVLLCSLFLVACNQDEDLLPAPPNNPDATTNVTPPDNNSSQVNSLVAVTDSLPCYEITFPITFIYEDGTTVTVNDEIELEAIFIDEENLPWDLGYPINLIDVATGETVSANNEEELFELLILCEGWDDGEWNGEDDDEWDEWPTDSFPDLGLGYIACYEIVFPATFNLADGTTQEINSEEEFGELIFSNNPPLDIAFPINLSNPENGEIVTANSEEELGELIENCGDDWNGGGNGGGDNGGGDCDPFFGQIGCYQMAYPATLTLADSTTAEVNSQEELFELAFSDNPPVGFIFPVSVENEDGDTFTANNEEELEALVEECEDEWGGGNGDLGAAYLLTFASSGEEDACYEYVYPVNFVNETGETSTANNIEEAYIALFSSDGGVNLEYPVQVTNVETGEILTANNEEEALELAEDCFE